MPTELKKHSEALRKARNNYLAEGPISCLKAMGRPGIDAIIEYGFSHEKPAIRMRAVTAVGEVGFLKDIPKLKNHMKKLVESKRPSDINKFEIANIIKATKGIARRRRK